MRTHMFIHINICIKIKKITIEWMIAYIYIHTYFIQHHILFELIFLEDPLHPLLVIAATTRAGLGPKYPNDLIDHTLVLRVGLYKQVFTRIQVGTLLVEGGTLLLSSFTFCVICSFTLYSLTSDIQTHTPHPLTHKPYSCI